MKIFDADAMLQSFFLSSPSIPDKNGEHEDRA